MFLRRVHAGGEVERYRMARTLLGKPVYIASCYRVGDVLVDAGPPNKALQVRAALRDARLRAILVTHGHEDHFGGAAALPEVPAYGAPGLALAHDLPFYRRAAWGEPSPVRIAAVPDAIEVRGLEFRPLPTPGHTPDHLAYWVPERGWLFAGDAALGPLKYGMRGEDLARYVASLKKMRDLKPAIVFPAHGPVLEHPQEQLGAQIAHLERLHAEARRLAAQGLREHAIARRLLGFDGWMGWASGGEFSKAQLIRELLEVP